MLSTLKKTGTALLATATLLGMSCTANAGLFEYSYQYTDGTSLTGTLTGDVNGDYVENIDNVTLTINTQTFSQTFYSVGFSRIQIRSASSNQVEKAVS